MTPRSFCAWPCTSIISRHFPARAASASASPAAPAREGGREGAGGCRSIGPDPWPSLLLRCGDSRRGDSSAPRRGRLGRRGVGEVVGEAAAPGAGEATEGRRGDSEAARSVSLLREAPRPLGRRAKLRGGAAGRLASGSCALAAPAAPGAPGAALSAAVPGGASATGLLPLLQRTSLAIGPKARKEDKTPRDPFAGGPGPAGGLGLGLGLAAGEALPAEGAAALSRMGAIMSG